MVVPFADRIEAGRALAERLGHLRGQDVVVLGLPRGGVPVASQVAEALDAPLDVIVVRKLGVPLQPELAMGAVGEGDAVLVDSSLWVVARISPADVRRVERRERQSLEERVALLRRGRDRIDLAGRIAVIVDDGIATGSTARVACEIARRRGAAEVVLAVPVAPTETLRHLPEADEVVCLRSPQHFVAVGLHYLDFSPTTDEEVVVLLDAAARRMRRARRAENGPDCETDVEIPVDGTRDARNPSSGAVPDTGGEG